MGLNFYLENFHYLWPDVYDILNISFNIRETKIPKKSTKVKHLCGYYKSNKIIFNIFLGSLKILECEMEHDTSVMIILKPDLKRNISIIIHCSVFQISTYFIRSNFVLSASIWVLTFNRKKYCCLKKPLYSIHAYLLKFIQFYKLFQHC